MNRNGSSPDVIINVENNVPCSKELFLSNVTNKEQLISLLSEYFKNDGHNVHVCKGDADSVIVSTALEVSKRSTTTFVADDIDVAIMTSQLCCIIGRQHYLLYSSSKNVVRNCGILEVAKKIFRTSVNIFCSFMLGLGVIQLQQSIEKENQLL